MMLIPVAEAKKRIEAGESFVLWQTEKHRAHVFPDYISVVREMKNERNEVRILFQLPRDQWKGLREFLAGISDEEKTPWDLFNGDK